MILSESNKKRLQELANIVNEKGGTPRTVSLTSKKSGKYRNPKGPAKYFAAYNGLKEDSSKSIKLPIKYVHENLNQEIWNGTKLRPKIAKALKVIAKDFNESLKVDAKIIDIWFTGSLANYNWTNFSDIDLHIIIDYEDINEDKDFAFEYVDAKKDVWLGKHDIKIKGFDVEPYAQDIEAPTGGMSAVYSLKYDKWLKKPSLENPEIDKKSIKKKIKSIVKKIEKVESIKDLEKSQNEGKKLKEKIKKMRKSGLAESGEFSEENLVFKYLRNNGFIGRLFDSIRSSYDKSLSINEESNSTYEYDENTNYITSEELIGKIKFKDDSQKEKISKKILPYSKYVIQEIPVATINKKDYDYNDEKVDLYVEKTKFNPDYPPIIFDSKNNSIIDGVHRVKALEKMGYDKVRAYVGVEQEINESIREIVRNQINELFNSKGFHASMEDWLNKWKKKGVEVDADSYGDGMDMGISKRDTLLSEEDEIFATDIEVASPSEYDVIEVEIGTEVEMEHTDNRDEAKKIALQHLDHNGNYYTDAIECGLIDEPRALEIYSRHLKGEPLLEKFSSKAQQRYFYAMANKPGKKGKQWKKWAKEFSDDTDFKSLPEKVNEIEVDNEIFQSDNKQKLQNIANILYGMGLDEENASSIFLHKDKIYVPISNFDGYDKKDFQRATLERGYNVSVNGPNFIIDLSNPAFSLNESIVTDEERSWLKFLDNANTQPANDPKLFVKNAYDAGFPEVAIVDALQTNGRHDKDSAETYYYNVVGQYVDSINESVEKSKNHNLFLEKNINDEHGQNSEDFKEFIMFCCDSAGINLPTKIYLRGTRDEKLRTTASYNPNNHDIHIYCKGRHMVDVMRSVAHELMHMKQMLDNRLYDNSGDDGSNEENEAHSFSGLMIRKFGRERPKIYEGYSKGGNLI
jgi:hypothetical protein